MTDKEDEDEPSQTAAESLKLGGLEGCWHILPVVPGSPWLAPYDQGSAPNKAARKEAQVRRLMA